VANPEQGPNDPAVVAWAVVVAAGAGERLGGDTPKGFVELDGRPLCEWSLLAIGASSVVSGIVLVVPPGFVPQGERISVASGIVKAVVTGDTTRQGSVFAGMAEVPPDAPVILVHDAARPLADPDLFRRVVAALRETGSMGVVPVVPSADTVKRVTDGRVVETIARHDVGLAQTPQAFVASALREAHDRARASGLEGTDDAALLEANGQPVTVVHGQSENFKVTTPQDLERAETLLAARHAEKRGAAGG
jgi:2-C-methyl-D-erythritol 4-phosphate cytidylyltransferase